MATRRRDGFGFVPVLPNPTNTLISQPQPPAPTADPLFPLFEPPDIAPGEVTRDQGIMAIEFFLPDVILARICSFLDPKSHGLSFALVDKSWEEASRLRVSWSLIPTTKLFLKAYDSLLLVPAHWAESLLDLSLEWHAGDLPPPPLPQTLT
eukprot:gene8151-7507_t